MTWVAVGVGVAGAAVSAYGSISAGNAASKAARAQQDAAEAYKRFNASQQKLATDMVTTPSAIAAHETALHAQENAVRRQEALAQQLEPSLVEAGKQTAQLLQGKSAPVLANLQQQRQLQRTQMLDNLRQQLGPGAETSSAGMQALNQFDQQTSNIMNGAQQEYLDKVSNLSLGGGATLSETLGKANTALSQINASGPQERAAQLIAQFTMGGQGAQMAGVEAAGGEFKGQQLQGQGMMQAGGALIQGAAAYAGNRSLNKSNTTSTTTPGDNPAAGMQSASLNSPTLGSSFGGQPSYGLGGGSAGGGGATGAYAGNAVSSFSGAGPAIGGYQGASGSGRSNYLNLGDSVGGINMPNYASDNLGQRFGNTAGGGY